MCELCQEYTFFCEKEKCKVCRREYHQEELTRRMCESCLENTAECKLCKDICHKNVLKNGRCISCSWKKGKTKEGKTKWIWKNFEVGRTKGGYLGMKRGYNNWIEGFTPTPLSDERLNSDNVWKNFEKFLKQLKEI